MQHNLPKAQHETLLLKKSLYELADLLFSPAATKTGIKRNRARKFIEEMNVIDDDVS